MTKKEIIKTGMIKASPIMTSYMFLAIAYGILMEEAGIHWYYSMLASTIVYTGAFQYVLITFISGHASLFTTLVTALFMNSRQVFYSITYLEEYKSMGKKLPFMIHSLTDETYAVNFTVDKNHPHRKEILFWIGIFSWISWITGSVIGNVLGALIPYEMKGIDFCMTALFVIIFVDQWEKSDKHFAALTGLVVSLICLAIFGANKFMLPALLVVSVILLMYNQLAKANVKDDTVCEAEAFDENTHADIAEMSDGFSHSAADACKKEVES